MSDNYDAAKAKAQKILGKDAKIPEPKAVAKTAGDVFAAYDAFDKSRGDIEAKILTLQKALASHQLTLKQFAEQLDDNDFGLDEKNKDDAKKLKDAHAIFDDWAESKKAIVDADIDELDELDKHVISLRKYKPKTS